jgi:hypothetical protein
LKRRNPKQKSNARDFGLNCLHVNDDNAIPFWDLTRTRLIPREREKSEHHHLRKENTTVGEGEEWMTLVFFGH